MKKKTLRKIAFSVIMVVMIVVISTLFRVPEISADIDSGMISQGSWNHVRHESISADNPHPFSNEANVKNLKAKLAEQGIRTFSEPLDTPQGKKTRVRAGPFASREAAEKALEKMQRIGVSGAIAAKQ